MKKFLLSIGVGAFFVVYIVYQRNAVISNAQQASSAALNDPLNKQQDEVAMEGGTSATAGSEPVDKTNSASQSASNSSTPANTSTSSSTSTPKTTPTPTPPPPVSTGKFKDGVYTGNSADANYGTVQVRATVASGKLSKIEFLQFPNSRSTSVQISNFALPKLRTEAISGQTAKVNSVSGATYTSAAFVKSLTSALAQAQ